MRRLHFVAAAVIVSLSLLAPDLRVGAYSTNGHAWGVKNVLYYVNPASQHVSATAAVSAVQAAASTWNTQGGVDLQLVYAGTTQRSSLSLDYTNNVFFRNDSSGYLAETYWWWDGSGRLVDADIVFHEGYKFYAGGTGCNGDGYYIESVGAHEFGHAIGLGHSSVAPATMWPSSNACDTTFTTLDADDIAGLQKLYPLSSTTTTAPAAPSNPSPSSGATSVPTNVTLSWSSSNAQGYDLYVNDQLYAPGLTSRSLALASLAPGTRYTWRVVAYNSVGSTTGATWSFTTQTTQTTTTRKGRKR